MSNTSIILNHISVTTNESHLLQEISMALVAGEHLAIVGASRSGKSTLAKVIAGQLFVKGSMKIEYDDDSSLPKKAVLIEQRNQFKNLAHTADFYYQQRFNSFDNNDAQTVMQALLNNNVQQDIFRIELLLKQFGLYERKEAPLIQLSSGENKRFQLIKAILVQPQILILDSPFTGLDATARLQLYKTIDLLASKGTKIILITDAHQMPDCITHVALLEKRKLKTFVPKQEFYADSVASEACYFSDIYSLPVSENKIQYEYIVNMQNVTVAYSNKTILHGINWQIKPGDKWLVKGQNGAGKSTLLSLINGDNPQAYKNEIYLFDKRRGSGESIWDIKLKTGFISPELHAFYDKTATCYNAIASGFWDTIGLFKKLSLKQQNEVQKWITFLQLSSVQNKSFGSLSFGVQRLILLARALLKNPTLLILDEPCQGLDEEQKNTFINLINSICVQFNKTLIYVSHYDDEIPACVDKVLELKNGEQRIYSLQKKMELIIE